MTTKFSRRTVLKALGLGGAFALVPSLLPGVARAATVPHVVVVGGGFSGATAAKYLKMWGGLGVQVTLIEPNPTYVSPILSNLVLNEQKTTAGLSFGYLNHHQRYAVKMVHATVTNVDKTAKTLTLSNGQSIAYDRLVLAPGIDFVAAPGHDFDQVPHAWQAGVQTNLLKAQLDTMVDGDAFVMTVPAAPYRCPPGPYERACVVADFLKSKGLSNCTVTVLDANPGITIEELTFSAAFASYGITYVPNAVVQSVNSATKSVTYSVSGAANQTLSAKVLNVIPNQKAAPLIFTAGVNSGNWAPINPLSYESTVAGATGIYIIGDSQGTGQPKAGHMGNSQAKVCADAILRTLNNFPLDSAPKTNSACYSPISSNTASWLTAVYQYNSISQQMELVPGVGYPASEAPSADNYRDMFNWAGNLFSDTFA
ncbi:FAD-dependent oxidoreductase [Thiomicrorhabdus aquaedulcis]|uniref:FAD-dependent oxidoreductase n=1 Tax=Thiomicrorhabdus aquaedulcis TaxID=2211106 RepID=UPI000FD98CAB|nr:FAD/NAD(P)-binding oxidoreductase [Thiomicrorhabdus aquaedulcis]